MTLQIIQGSDRVYTNGSSSKGYKCDIGKSLRAEHDSCSARCLANLYNPQWNLIFEDL